ncbi:MAG: hypothetical protein D6811_11960 [Alphaproteobacteria bacterium]|nr:MAG: hypothetical protein D6811_11960 [Alphaproteobacteria bacterium]
MLETDGFEDAEGTVFRDLIMLTLAGFVTMVILMIPHLNPPAADGETPAPGNVVVEARWADGLPADVDLWVQGPGDAPVGYSRKSGRVFDLLRDDLGTERDGTELNYEFAFSRGAPAGEYTVNLHLFNAGRVPLPLPVTVTISLRHPEHGRVVRIASRKVTLTRQGEELTVARFRLDAQGQLEAGSLHDLPKSLLGVR